MHLQDGIFLQMLFPIPCPGRSEGYLSQPEGERLWKVMVTLSTTDVIPSEEFICCK